MSSEREIKPGMFVLWTGAHGAPPLPETVFLGVVVAELSEKEEDIKDGFCRASRRFSVFIRTNTTQDTKVIPIFEHRIVPYSKKPSRTISS